MHYQLFYTTIKVCSFYSLSHCEICSQNQLKICLNYCGICNTDTVGRIYQQNICSVALKVTQPWFVSKEGWPTKVKVDKKTQFMDGPISRRPGSRLEDCNSLKQKLDKVKMQGLKVYPLIEIELHLERCTNYN